jgi:Ca-activated chloride channel family protein
MNNQKSPRLSVRWGLNFIFGLLLVFVSTCSRMPSLQDLQNAPPMTTQEVQQVLQNRILSKVTVEDATVSDAQAMNYAIADIAPPLPSLDRFPLYGALAPSDPKTAPFVYVEIFSSSEKANAQKEDERWLVNVADAFNQKKVKASNGQEIQVGIRNIASGYAAQLIASKTVQPAGYSPANQPPIQI